MAQNIQPKEILKSADSVPVCFVCGKTLKSGYYCKQHKNSPQLHHSRFKYDKGELKVN